MIKFALIFGTRPEAIKMAPVVLEMKKQPGWDVKVIVTGQHREMLDQVLDIFQIQPDYDLDIMTHGQTLADITVKVLHGVTDILQDLQPTMVLVHGDTTTAFASALAAFYLHIPVGHIEAGLRTESIANPFPEEANRRLTDQMSSLYFAPTEHAANNLYQEGYCKNNIFITGNTVIDALLSVIDPDYNFQNDALAALDYGRPVILVTVHRRENWGAPLHNVCIALRTLAANFPDVQFVVAMHRNPRVQSVLQNELGDCPGIFLVEAPGYVEFANLMQRSTLVLTDSGGLQEEAPALQKPVLVMRDSTERPEGINAGTLELVGTNSRNIVDGVTRLLTNKKRYLSMANAPNPYGDGQAARRICELLKSNFLASEEQQ